MIVFDSDRCFRRKAIDYNLLSMSDLDEYAKIFYDYSTDNGFQHGTESVLIDLNRIHKEFRIIMNDTSSPDEIQWFSIYSNGNLKTLECMFHLLNFTYGNKNEIKGWMHIPKDIDRDGIDRLFNIGSRGTSTEESWLAKNGLLDKYIAFSRKFSTDYNYSMDEHNYHYVFGSYYKKYGIPLIRRW